MSVWKRRIPTIAPLVNNAAPFSPLKPRSRPSPSAPTIQTIGLECPSVVVTIGDPRPLLSPHHAVVMVGFGSATIFSTVRSPFGALPAGALESDEHPTRS